jgi:hypothetical protein
MWTLIWQNPGRVKMPASRCRPEGPGLDGYEESGDDGDHEEETGRNPEQSETIVHE